jgi:hypothetical protein
MQLRSTIAVWEGLGWTVDSHPILKIARAELAKHISMLDTAIIASSYHPDHEDEHMTARLAVVGDSRGEQCTVSVREEGSLLRALHLDRENGLALAAQLEHALRER